MCGEEKQLGINSSNDEILEEKDKLLSEVQALSEIDLPEDEKAIEMKKYVSRLSELERIIHEKKITE